MNSLHISIVVNLAILIDPINLVFLTLLDSTMVGF